MYPLTFSEAVFVESARISSTSVALAPVTCKPFNFKLRASTVEVNRSMATLPLPIVSALVAPRPPPMNTFRFLANTPPVFNPMDCDWRSISPSTLWNSLSSTVRSPVKVPDADCAASVRARSRSCEMLFRPPSMVCRLDKPSLAFRIPCVITARSERKPLAMARPAASSPELMIRNPDVTRLMVFC